MVYEARGDKEKAIEYYKKTAEFARSKEGFDPEFVNWALCSCQSACSTRSMTASWSSGLNRVNSAL